MNYTIQPGDTLSQIAQRHGTTVQAIAQANGIANPNMIRAGASLVIPGAGQPAPAPRSPGAPAPTTGAMPVSRPASVAARDPMAAPMPRPRPGAPGAPPAPSGSGMGSYNQPVQTNFAAPVAPQSPQQISAPQPGSLTTGSLTPEPSPDMWQGRQGSSYANEAQPRPPVQPGANGQPNILSQFLPNGLSDLPALPMNEFNRFRIAIYSDPALYNDQRLQATIEAEAQRRVQQLQTELQRIDQSQGMRDTRQLQWENAGEQMPRTPQPGAPTTIPGNPANPMPQGGGLEQMPLDPYGPAFAASWDIAQEEGRPLPQQMPDPVAALIQQLRSGGGTNQVPIASLIRQLQGAA